MANGTIINSWHHLFNNINKVEEFPMKLKERLKNNARRRRIAVIERLEEQLALGMKPHSRKRKEPESLTEKDVARIKSEINTLKQRV